jgi:hypothetical protein
MAEQVMAMIASFLFGCGFLVYACINAIKVGASRNWPQVAGTITRSHLECNTDPDTDPYIVSIQYQYAVNGAGYAGAQEMGRFIRESSAQACADRYAVHSRVVVHYDPEKPANAVLEPSYTKVIFAFVAAIVFLLMAGRLAFELAFR